MPKTLAQLRIDQALTQAELAAKVGVHQVTIGAWESAENIPNPLNFNRLAEALNISATELDAALEASKKQTKQ